MIVDIDALRDLIAEYELPLERSALPLFDAMTAHGGLQAVTQFATAADPETRRLAAKLAHALPDPAHLPALELLATDPDPDTARLGRAALRVQLRDSAWHALARRLRQSDDPELSAMAAGWAAGRP